MTLAEWDEVFALGLRAAWLCAEHALPGMLARVEGVTVNVASVHARLTTEGMFPCAAEESGWSGSPAASPWMSGRAGCG